MSEQHTLSDSNRAITVAFALSWAVWLCFSVVFGAAAVYGQSVRIWAGETCIVAFFAFTLYVGWREFAVPSRFKVSAVYGMSAAMAIMAVAFWASKAATHFFPYLISH